jgi:hypothetical protein
VQRPPLDTVFPDEEVEPEVEDVVAVGVGAADNGE